MSNPALSNILDDLLEKEYHALLSGKIDDIEALGVEKMEVLERIEALNEHEMSKFLVFRERLLRNQSLAESAIAGMRKAILRTKDVSDVSTGLRTYGPNGQKQRVTTKAPQILSKRS